MPDVHHHDAALVQAIAAGMTSRQAGEQVGVRQATVERRRADSAFMAEVERVRREHLDRLVALLTTAALSAALVLTNLARDPQVADNTRLRAAISVIEMMVKVVDVAKVDQRLSDLETRMLALDAGGSMDLNALARRVLATTNGQAA